MQILGICRFSYPATRGFQSQSGDLQNRMDQLFEPNRIAERFAYFEHVLLPGIRAQTNTSFTLIVMTGDTIPAPHKSRLIELVSDIPQIKLVFHPPDEHRVAVSEVIQNHIDPEAAFTAQFRLDDDDGVAVNFIQSVRNQSRLLKPFIEHHQEVALDYNDGILVSVDQTGVHASRVKEPYWTPGLVVFLPKGHTKTIINYPHFRIHKLMQTVTITKPVMFVRGLNETNDSPFWKHREPPSLATPDMTALLADRFAISVDALHSAFRHKKTPL